MGTRNLPPFVASALEQDTVRPFFGVEMLFDTSPIRLWTGTGDLDVGGVTFIGTGALLDISSVEETSELAVKGATLTLSGMNSEVVSLALQEPYQGRVCNVFFGLNIRNQLAAENGNVLTTESGLYFDMGYGSSITQIFAGYMDEMNIVESAQFSSIELKVENRLIDLERPRVQRYTSAYQKARYPKDKGLDFIESLQNKSTPWGKSV